MHVLNDCIETGLRRPIQCQGIVRGPDRMTKVAISGTMTTSQSTMAKIDWQTLLRPTPRSYWSPPTL